MITLPIIVGTITISMLVAAGFESKESDKENKKKKKENKMNEGMQDAYVEKRMTRRNRCGYIKLDTEKRK
ncbi:MAG: hypothetical protein JEZ08_09075 [Clostridiales bacterium]|nr:hypothetical protein [Clostridiales bacterium]